MSFWKERKALAWTLGLSLMLLFLLIGSLASRPRSPIWPQTSQWSITPYSDHELEGGQSRVINFQRDAQALRVGLLFGSLERGRYAGVAVKPVREGMVDLSAMHFVKIKYRTRAVVPLRLQIQLDLPGHTRPGEFNSQRCLQADLPPVTEWTELLIPFSDFHTPQWWYLNNRLSPSFPDHVDFSRFLSMNICDADLAPAGLPQEIEVRALSFEGSWQRSIWLACLLPLPGLGLTLWTYRKKIPRKREPVSPYGIPLDLQNQEDSDFQRISQLIAQRYSDPDLGLSAINRETGISEPQISSILEKRTGLRFKPYLNQVRIGEAARLLLESDRTITEIAFMVGYSNTTHFNRVFRTLKNVAPGEFRRASKDTQTTV